jgi:transketolase
LPNMSIVVPADPLEAQSLAKISYEHQGPIYIRLGPTGEPYVYDSEPDFKIGKAVMLREGKEVAIFAIGNMVYIGKEVVNMLSRKGISATLINMHTLKPLDLEIINQVATIHDGIFTLEEHNIHGGLGSAVAEVLTENRYYGYFKRIGIDNEIRNYIGNAEFLREKCGLTCEHIYEKVLNEMNKDDKSFIPSPVFKSREFEPI